MGHSSKYQIHSYYASVSATAKTQKNASFAEVVGGLFMLALGSGIIGFAAYVLSTIL